MVNIYEILQKIGFDWQVALANLVNFLIILFLLKKFAFKPIAKLIKDRQDKISEGLQKAKEAEVRLKEVDQIAKNKLKNADLQAITIIKNMEDKAKELEQSLQAKSQAEQKKLAQRIQSEYEVLTKEAKENATKEASKLVKAFIVKTVQLQPKQIDEALLSKAILQMKDEN